MSIQFYCTHCGVQLNVPKQHAGQAGKCNQCGQRIVVPGDVTFAAEESAQVIGGGPSQRTGMSANRLTMAAALIVMLVVAAIAFNIQRVNPDGAPDSSANAIVVSENERSASAHPPPDTVDSLSLESRIASLLPTEEEDRFLKIPWRTNLLEARAEASEQKKPIFMWVMNGDPLGCV